MKSHFVSRNLHRTEMMMQAMILSSLNLMALPNFLYLSVIFKISWMSLGKQWWHFSLLSLFWDSKSFFILIEDNQYKKILKPKTEKVTEKVKLASTYYNTMTNKLSPASNLSLTNEWFWNIILIQNLIDIARFINLERVLWDL